MRDWPVGDGRDTMYTSGEPWKAKHGLTSHSSNSEDDFDLAQQQVTQHLRNPAQIIGFLLCTLKASAKASISRLSPPL